MAVPFDQSYNIKSFVFTDEDATVYTWDASSGGPLTLFIDESGTPANEFVADNSRPTNNTVLDIRTSVVVNIAEFRPSTFPSINDRGTAVATLVNNLDDTNTKVINLYGLVFEGARDSQQRGQAGGTEIRYVFESSDGQKDVFTAP